MALTKLTSNLIEGGTGTDWVTAIQTSNFTAAAGKGYFVNTTSQVLYVNLPVGVVGMEITIQDYAGTFATNKVVLNANGSEKIQGSALEGRINTKNATAVLIYQDATKGWTSQDVSLNATTISWDTPTGQSLTYSTPSPQSSQGAAAATFPTTTFTATKAGSTISGTATIAGLPTGITAAQTITGSGVGNTLTVTLTGTFPSTDYINTALTLSGLSVITPLTVDYLVVAGGGGTGYGGNVIGAGAGGLRTSYGSTSGGGGSAEATLTLLPSTNYTVTIGAGGTGSGAGTLGNGTSGQNSVFNSITSIGGGRSSGNNNFNGTNGGSGGGPGQNLSTSYSPGLGTANQGYNAGTGVNVSGGSGGGAGGAGTGVSNGGSSTPGGAGLAVSITGSSITYAAGGGSYNSVGLTNTGNGAGNGNAGGSGGAGGWGGGSGIVILRYPSAKTITNPGAGLTFTTATDGSDKVTTFTAGTGNIQFN